MNVIENELVVGCDVDDTILMWDKPNDPGAGKLEVDFAGRKVYLTPHQYHVDLLRSYHERGYYIIIWSANGWRHAKQAAKLLGLEDLVSGKNGQVQVKLTKHMDDNPNAESIVGPRVYCADLTKEIDGNTSVSQ
jgi:hydroxymethylpyrimidine pyrophosphatase-like HAD family hydrolase